MNRLFTLLFLILQSIISNGQTWTGSISNDWNTAGNWSTNTIPVINSYVIIPGTGITNWPTLSSNIMVENLKFLPGSQINTKGFLIDVYGLGSQALTIQGATIKNTTPDTEIFIRFFGSGSVLNSTFEANAIITFSAPYLKIYPAFFTEGGNHFTANVKFVEIGDETMDLSVTKSFYDGNLEIERPYPISTGDPYYIPSPSLFVGGAAINGNFKYTSLYPADIYFGNSQGNAIAQINGNLDIKINGNISTSNLIVNGISTAKLVGSKISRIYHYGTTPYSLTNLSVEKTAGASLSLQTPLSISGNVKFTSGNIISTGTNPLILLNGATTSGASNTSHVVGVLQKVGNEAFTFPVGLLTGLFPVSISAPASSTDIFSASFSSTSLADGYNPATKATTLYKVSGGGYWDVKRVSGTSDVKVILSYSDQGGSVTDASELRVAHWNGSLWEDLGNGGTSGSLADGTVSTLSNVSNFSPFTLATSDASNPLPVKLVDFAVVKEGLIAAINWRTTQEINSDRFDVEHSNDALIWSKIGEVKATNEAKIFSSYQFIHNDPVAGNNYYRLKMIDNDRSFAYSKIVTLKFSDEKAQLVFYPNPASEKLSVQTPQNTIIDRVTFLNKLGQLVLVPTTANNNIDISKLQTGNYVLRVKLANGSTETHNISISR